MRERLGIYVLFALAGAPLAYVWARPFNLSALGVAKPQPNDLLPIVYEFLRDLIPFLALSIAARFFIVTSTMRRIDPTYQTTPRRFLVQFGMMFVILAYSYLGFYGTALPGYLGTAASLALLAISVAAVLLSQSLFAALADGGGANFAGAPVKDALKLSYEMTRTSFVPTLLVTAIGIFFVVFPINIAILPLFLAMILKSPKWLAAGTPVLILLFVYLESVRFTLMARWYTRLAHGAQAA